MADWPDHLRIAERDGLDLGALKTGGGIVEEFSRCGEERADVPFRKGRRNNAVERLLHRVEDRKSALSAAIADRKEQYDQEKFRKHIPKIDPITDPESCSFHSGSNNQFEGVGYIAELPRDIESVLPEVVKRLLFVGMGSIEYCLEIFYQRGVSERGAIDEMYQNVLVASIGDWMDLLGRTTTYGSKSTSGN